LAPVTPSFFPIHSQTQIIFISGCNLAGPERAFCSLRKAQHHLNIVIETPTGHERSYVCSHLLARQSGHEARKIEGVCPDISKRSPRPAAGGIGAPFRLLVTGLV